MSYRERFLAMVKGLETPKFRIHELEIGEPASPELVAEATKAAGGKLPPGVAELYSELDGFTLKWEQIDDFPDELYDNPTGYISIPKIYGPRRADGVFSDWRDAMYFSDDDPLKAVRPFDLSGGDMGSNTSSVFYPIPGDASIHYHDSEGGIHPTGYDLAGYVERLLVSRGFLYWSESLSVAQRESGEAETFLHDAPLIFDGFDASLFVPNTKEGQIVF